MPKSPVMSTQSVATIDRVHVDRSHRDWLLFALAVSSGAVDAISFLALGKVFTGFMTGNVIFLGMGIARSAAAPSIIAVLLAMAGFGLGAYLATLIVTPRQNAADDNTQIAGVVWPSRVTYALAVSLLPHLAFVVLWTAIGGRPSGNATLALLAAWALAMGMQSAAVRGLNVGGVYTTAATATFIFLFGDFARRPLTREERHRLSGVLVSMVIGAAAGARLLIDGPTYAPLLPFGITVIVVAIAAKAFAHGDNSHVFP
jgi:uncharacterized membrane protein YoaK (UPF0700 family)